VLAELDSALVSSASGTSASWHRRDPKMFRTLMWRSVVAHRKLWRQWPQLAAQYRAAAPEFNSPERWRESFEASLSKAREMP
jgi:galactofuranosylgalactofuranosylrhamnosyl-N-acetylglucosaminyl-diphospho-decaprenol beta-1,5/1,6-galactofuranosyltransferase